jgi:ABC-2 type transport system permease protein
MAPLTVPARVLLGHPAWWELPVSVALMVVASIGLVRLGARAYGGAVLRFGPKLSVSELMKVRPARRAATMRAEGSS